MFDRSKPKRFRGPKVFEVNDQMIVANSARAAKQIYIDNFGEDSDYEITRSLGPFKLQDEETEKTRIVTEKEFAESVDVFGGGVVFPVIFSSALLIESSGPIRAFCSGVALAGAAIWDARVAMNRSN